MDIITNNLQLAVTKNNINQRNKLEKMIDFEDYQRI